MATIPANYPDGSSDNEIKTAIREMQDDLASAKYSINAVLQFSPLINLGQFELERRQSTAILKQSRVVSGISILIALLAVGISVAGNISSSEWESVQLKALSSINSNTKIAPLLHDQKQTLESISVQLEKETVCVIKGQEDNVLESQQGEACKK